MALDQHRPALSRQPDQGVHSHSKEPGGIAGPQAVAVGALYADGAMAWMGVGATVPEHRGKGAQGALIGKNFLLY